MGQETIETLSYLQIVLNWAWQPWLIDKDDDLITRRIYLAYSNQFVNLVWRLWCPLTTLWSLSMEVSQYNDRPSMVWHALAVDIKNYLKNFFIPVTKNVDATFCYIILFLQFHFPVYEVFLKKSPGYFFSQPRVSCFPRSSNQIMDLI